MARKRKSKKIDGARPLPVGGSNGTRTAAFGFLNRQFERSHRRHYEDLCALIDAGLYEQLCTEAAKGFEQAKERRPGNRWPMFKERIEDLPQAVCVLFVFADIHQEDQGQEWDKAFVSSEMQLQYGQAIAELREGVWESLRQGPQDEADPFTACMVQVEKRFPLPASEPQDSKPKSEPKSAAEIEATTKEVEGLGWRAQALALRFEKPDWSVGKIAQKVGRHRSTIYGDPELGPAFKAHREQRQAPNKLPPGDKDGKTGQVEAEDYR